MKHAKYGLNTAIEVDSADYFLANAIAERIGFITIGGVIKDDAEKTAVFVRVFDEEN